MIAAVAATAATARALLLFLVVMVMEMVVLFGVEAFVMDLSGDGMLSLEVETLSSGVYKFTATLNSRNAWIAIGATTSTGLGESITEISNVPNAVPYTGAVLGTTSEGVQEIDVTSDTDTIVLHVQPFVPTDQITSCILSSCSSQFGQCESSTPCAGSMNCIQTQISANNGKIFTAQEFKNGNLTTLENCLTNALTGGNPTVVPNNQNIITILQLLTCFVQECSSALEGDIAQRVNHISDTSFTQTSTPQETNTVMQFTVSNSIGFVPLGSFDPSDGDTSNSSKLTTLVWAYGETNEYADHGPNARGTVTINLNTGSTSIQRDMPAWIQTHVILMCLAFGVLIPISAMIFIILHAFESNLSNLTTKILWSIKIFCQLAAVVLSTTGIAIAVINVVLVTQSPHLVLSSFALTFFIFSLVVAICIPLSSSTSDRQIKRIKNKAEFLDRSQTKQLQWFWTGTYFFSGFLTIALGAISAYFGNVELMNRATIVSVPPIFTTIGDAMLGIAGFIVIFYFICACFAAAVKKSEHDKENALADLAVIPLVQSSSLATSTTSMMQQLPTRPPRPGDSRSTASPDDDDDDDVEEVAPMHLSFQNVQFLTPQKPAGICDSLNECLATEDRPHPNEEKNKRKPIIEGVSGYCAPRTLTAILGPSGAGKSTLLSLLTLRIGPQPTDELPNIRLNGKSVYDIPGYSRVTGYVIQQDVLFEVLTVFETIYFAAKLMIPAPLMSEGASKDPVKDRVMQVLHQLRLTHAANSQVGGGANVRGVSGGERRRVSIGIQLVSSPSLLFLDEPTSGLDFSSAQQVVSVLRELANRGHTIVATVHQPSASIFEQFDRLILLSAGKLIYSGTRTDAIRFFTMNGYPIPREWNPADWYIHIVNAVRASTPQEEEVASSHATFASAATMITVDPARARMRDSLRFDMSVLRETITEYYREHNPARLQKSKGIDDVVRYAIVHGLPELDKKLKATYGVGLTPKNDATTPPAMTVGSTFKSLTMPQLEALALSFIRSKFNEDLNASIQGVDKDTVAKFMIKSTRLNAGIISKSDPIRILAFYNAVQENEATETKVRKEEVDSYPQSTSNQVQILLWRNLLVGWRTPEVIKLQIGQNVILGIVIGSLYSSVQNAAASRPYNASMAMVVIMGILSMTTVAIQAQVSFNEKQIYLREQNDALYSPVAYIQAKMIVQIPLNFLIALTLIAISYFWIGLNPDPGAFLFFLAVNFVFVMVFDAFSALVSSWATSQSGTFVIANFYEAITVFFSGIFIQYPQIPIYYQWLVWLSPFSYGFSALMVNEFQKSQTDSWWIDAMGVQWQDKWGNLLVLIAFFVVFRAAHFFQLIRNSKERYKRR